MIVMNNMAEYGKNVIIMYFTLIHKCLNKKPTHV